MLDLKTYNSYQSSPHYQYEYKVNKFNLVYRYTSKMLLAAIDENHRGTYDFIYLPIDFKVIARPLVNCHSCGFSLLLLVHLIGCVLLLFSQNKCNVGYAFINMTKPQHIIPFYQVGRSPQINFNVENYLLNLMFLVLPIGYQCILDIYFLFA